MTERRNGMNNEGKVVREGTEEGGRSIIHTFTDEELAAHDAEVRADEAAEWAQSVIVSGIQGERIGATRARASCVECSPPKDRKAKRHE